MTTSQSFFSDGAALAAFLDRDWQQRPRFLPDALTTLPALPDWRALCASEQVESRRVTTRDNTYALEHGPFAGADPSPPWTVLIQDADYHAPALRPLLDTMRFLPRWRLEDIMMSVATAGASVGPHVDAYDVFLVQARGTRSWQVGHSGTYRARSDDSGLRLVAPFGAEHTWEARPGDVLYLPPDVPHHGTAATDDCVTLSIGFRAPSLQDIAATLLASAPDGPRYRDPPLAPATAPGAIEASALQQLRAQLKRFATLSDTHLLEAFGELVTEPKDWLAPEPRDTGWPASARQATLNAGARLAYGHAEGRGRAFANGVAYGLADAESEQFVAGLCATKTVPIPDSAAGRELLEQLWEDGIVDTA